MKNLRKICEHLDAPELLAQLAEEAGELTRAALKLRRAMTHTNPTPCPASKALSDLLEEIADVLNCLDAVEYSLELDRDLALQIMERKRTRWIKRLEGTAND
jgi:NTP pyrophosphatase (non-canonical NTP hydrolase)